jgi:opacity protein-like surface antigen
MKKILLATALAAVSLSVTEAKWDGFYLRGGLTVTGNGNTIKVEDKTQSGDGFKLDSNIEIAGGWGTTVANNAVYLGVDAQIGNFNVGYESRTITAGVDAKSTTTVAWAPSAQVRIGVPLSTALPYVAAGLGYTKLVSKTDVTDLPEGKMSWSIRVGSDFKVTESFFVGLFGQFTKTFADKNDTTKVETATSNTTVGFTAGWQF